MQANDFHQIELLEIELFGHLTSRLGQEDILFEILFQVRLIFLTFKNNFLMFHKA